MDTRPHNGKVEQERNSHWSSPSKLSHQAAQWKNLLAKSLPYLPEASRRLQGEKDKFEFDVGMRNAQLDDDLMVVKKGFKKQELKLKMNRLKRKSTSYDLM